MAVLPASTGPDGFYDELTVALRLHDWFGRNLDALADTLADLVTPTVLVLDDWTRYARADPEHWRRLVDLLVERSHESPPFVVLLA